MISLECTICMECFDENKHRPRCLPCGHTICTACIDHSIGIGDKTCPNCRKPHKAQRASKLPVNFIVEDIKQNLFENQSATSDLSNITEQEKKEKDSKVGSFNIDVKHENIFCDCCNGPVCGFRYKCLICDDYDLCGNCENKIYHTPHPMLRVPSPKSLIDFANKIEVKGESSSYDPTFIHEGVECDGCYCKVIGYRYKCLICSNYDLCHTCEHAGKHSQHVIARLPTTTSKIEFKSKRGTENHQKIKIKVL
ncbi:unnamed protein product [Meganyctiphanes norvegica]|uniref:Uncharacterized protein n=1 Tax=Meganyctiphanes norvegica TaxID=48144 RepID=A0AAV2SBE9_MEGNR